MNKEALTLAYYNENTMDFIAGTVNVDFHETQDRFLRLLPQNAHILDFGCGSGRDTKYFLEHGYAVDAIDGSEKLCEFASRYTGISVRKMLFQELDEVEVYDGIWACSSILHLPYDELKDVFVKMKNAIRTGGVIYTSFKYGRFSGERNGRYFTDLDEAGLQELLRDAEGLSVIDLWVTGDVRPGRGDEKWLNLLLRRQ